jgi:hypothetical protein
MIERMEGCPGCKLGQPEIIGRQRQIDGEVVTEFRVQCATCGYGRERQTYEAPTTAVAYWNAREDRDTAGPARDPETAFAEDVDVFAS